MVFATKSEIMRSVIQWLSGGATGDELKAYYEVTVPVGPEAARPDPQNYAGEYYAASDTLLLYKSDGESWLQEVRLDNSNQFVEMLIEQAKQQNDIVE